MSDEKPPGPLVGRMVERDGVMHAVFDEAEVGAMIDRMPESGYTDDEAGEEARCFDEYEQRFWLSGPDAEPRHALYFETVHGTPHLIRCTCGEFDLPVDERGGFPFSALSVILAHDEDARIPDPAASRERA